MVFGTKREHKPDADAREDVIGTLYPDTYSSEVAVTAQAMDYRRDAGDESVIDPHARFNGKYMSDRDLRIEGEALGEIECLGTLIIAPQAKVRAAIKALHVVINGDYEGEVDCGGRFEIGSTGRVKGTVKTQVLVVKEGAHWEGSVVMTHEQARGSAAAASSGSSQSAPTPAPSGKGAAAAANAASNTSNASNASSSSSNSNESDGDGQGMFKEPERAATGPGASN